MVQRLCETAVLTGTGRSDILKGFGEVLSENSGLELKPDETPDPGSFDMLILCPGNDAEFSSMQSDPLPRGDFSKYPSPVITTFGKGEPIKGFPILLSPADLSYRLIEGLPGYVHMLNRENSSCRISSWINTGSLLPFFVHNINNMLARIMGNTELAQLFISQPEKAGEKLASALSGVEDLREFVQGLAGLSVAADDRAPWCREGVAGLERMGRMFSGRSVDFSLIVEDGTPETLDASAGYVNVAVGLASAAVAVTVNGCGKIELVTSSVAGFGSFTLNWTASRSGSGLITDGPWAAADLMSAAAAFCCRFGFHLHLRSWSTDEGKVSIFVSRGE